MAAVFAGELKLGRASESGARPELPFTLFLNKSLLKRFQSKVRAARYLRQ